MYFSKTKAKLLFPPYIKVAYLALRIVNPSIQDLKCKS